MKTKLTLALLAAVMITSVGCSSPKAATPKQAVLNLQKALEKGKEKNFLACFDADENQRRSLAAGFQMLMASRNLEKKVAAAYDDDFAAEIAGGDMFDSLQDVKPDDIKIEQDGDDKATATIPNENEPMELVRKDGVWLIAVGEEMPSSAEEIDKMVELLGTMTKVMKDFAGKAGGGLSKEEFQQQFETAMSEAMSGMFE